MITKGISQRLLFTLIVKLVLNFADALVLSINQIDRTVFEITEQRSTNNQLITPNNQLTVPAGPIVWPKASKPAPISNLNMAHTVYWFRKALRVHDNPGFGEQRRLQVFVTVHLVFLLGGGRTVTVLLTAVGRANSPFPSCYTTRRRVEIS